MKFNDFIKIYKDAPFIDSSSFSLYDNPEHLRRQVWNWTKKGYLLPLKKGLYIFAQEYRKLQPSVLFVANFLVVPSYVSLEYVLGENNIIPEKVTVFTSVTTKKTNVFENCLGRFEYRSVKENLFFGFKKQTYHNQKIFIASPEKALLDYFYLNHNSDGDFSYFESMRLQNLEILDADLLNSYLNRYNARVKTIAKRLIEYTAFLKNNYKRL